MMRLVEPISIALATCLLAACGGDPAPAPTPDTEMKVVEPEAPAEEPDETETPEAYDDTWNLSEFWPGEYPPGISVLEEGVTLNARATMDPDAAANIACPLPRGATYQPWNAERNVADQLEFVAATEIFDVTLSEDFDLPAYAVEGPSGDATLPLKAGDTVTFLVYIGEGFAVFRHDGKEYQVDQQDLRNVSDLESVGADKDEHLWVRVMCASEDKTRAWVLLSEATEVSGIGPTPITGYGESSDLDEAGIERAKTEMAVQEQYENYAYVDSFLDGAQVTSPLTVTGVAPGDWYFENVFPVRLMVNGEEIAFAHANPDTNWTEPGHKSFKAILEFSVSENTPATLVLEEDMPEEETPPRKTTVNLVLIPGQ